MFALFVGVCFPSREAECVVLHELIHTCMKPSVWTVRALCCLTPTVIEESVCACVNSRKGSCSGEILICQVGLVKSSTGREGDGGDLPWPVSDMKETKKEKKITDDFPVRLALPASCRLYQLSYQLVLLRMHFPLGFCNRHLHGSLSWWEMCEKGFLWYFWGDYDTACGGNVCSLCCQGWKCWEKCKGKIKWEYQQSEFSLIAAWSMHLQSWRNHAPS